MISRLMRPLQMGSKLPAQTSLATAVNLKFYMFRKLIHWATCTLTGKNNNNHSLIMMPRRTVAVFLVAIQKV